MEPKLRVCVIAACPFPANHGTPGSIRELSEGMANRGHDVHVVTYHFGDESIESGRIQLHRIHPLFKEDGIAVGPTSRKPVYDLQLIFKAIQVVRKFNCDVIHAHGYEAALAAFWARFFTWRPFIYSAHNSMSDELASYNFFRAKWVADGLAWTLDATVPRMGDLCIPHSENMVDFLDERRLQKRTFPVINFGIDLSTPPESQGAALRAQYFSDDCPTVVYAGVMNEFQRLDLLLAAMALVAEAIPDVRLLMVVTIDQHEHQAWICDEAKRLGIADKVVLTEPQPLAGVQHLIRASDVTVVPRPKAPGYPIKLLNYMAAEKPCVMFASSCSGLTHGENVWLAAEDTCESLADALVELLSDPHLQRDIGAAALEFVQQHHDRKRSAERVAQAYIRVLERKRRWRNDIAKRPPAIVEGAALPANSEKQTEAAHTKVRVSEG